MKKKIFIVGLLAITLLLSSAIISNASPEDTVYIYAPDGRTSLVMEYEIDYYQSLGWYPYPVITMYAADGRETIVRPEETEYYQNLGWYTQPLDMLNKEYYPGTTIPTFDSVTGIRLTKKEKISDGRTLYSYKFRNMPEAETWFVYNDYLLEVAGCTFISGNTTHSDEPALIGLYTKGESGILFGIEFGNDTLFVIPLK